MNLETGELRELGRWLWPITRSPQSEPPEIGAPVTRLFLDSDDRLIRLDPETGAQTVVLGGAGSHRRMR